MQEQAMQKRIQILLIALSLLAGLSVSGCATNPVSGRPNLVLMSESQEIATGKKYHQEVMKQYRPYNDPALQKYVEGIVAELDEVSHRSHLDFHVTVLDSPQVNAFALPGGYLYITRGIMAYMNSEAELAGVLGHELGHITARHGVRQQTAGTLAGLLGVGAGILTGSGQVAQAANLGGTALVRGYGRSHELEADRLGSEYLARVGYDPEEMINVVGILKAQEEYDKQLAKEEGREPRAYHGTFSTHPANDRRLQEVVMAANKFKTAATRDANREKFLNYMNGVVIGDAEQDGILRGNKFYHKDLNLFVEFPEGWRINNLPDRLLAINGAQDVQLQITAGQIKSGTSPKQHLENLTKGNLSKGQAIKTASFNGYTGFSKIAIQGRNLPARVATIVDDLRTYDIAIVGKDQTALNNNDGAGFATIRSMRKLKRSERKLAEAKHIKLIRAKPGDTFSKLAKRSSISKHAVEQLRLLNGMYPDGEPKAGQLIKIVQ